MNQQLPKVYVSILNWNNYRNTIACLQSLQESKYENMHLVVIDNGSQDVSVDEIKRAFADIKIIQSGENLGFAGGHQLVVEQALKDGAELVWILNNDAHVLPDTLVALVGSYRKEHFAIYGSVPFRDSETTTIASTSWAVDEQGRSIPEKLKIYRDMPYNEILALGDRIQVANLNGSSMLIPTAIVREYGFMDSSFFLYQEETDYCFRLGAAGIPSYLVSKSVVIHKGHGSSQSHERLKPILTYYYTRNYLVRVKRYWPSALYRAIVWKMLRQNWKHWIKSVLRLGQHSQMDSDSYYKLLGFWDGLWSQLGKRFDPADFIN